MCVWLKIMEILSSVEIKYHPTDQWHPWIKLYPIGHCKPLAEMAANNPNIFGVRIVNYELIERSIHLLKDKDV